MKDKFHPLKMLRHFLFVSLFFVLSLEARILYVDQNSIAVGIRDGSSWDTAFLDLQSALDAAQADPEVDQIWIAEGIYRPSRTYTPLDLNGQPVVAGAFSLPENNPGITVDEALINYADNPAEFNRKLITFNLINNVSLYGGFQGQKGHCGGETSLCQRSSNITRHQTILDGNLSGEPNNPDNVWHVLTAGNDITFEGVNVVLDRLVVRNGNALAAPSFPINFPLDPGQVPIYFHNSGGGLYVFTHSHILLNQVIFEFNQAVEGGAVFAEDGSTIIVNQSQFNNNLAYEGAALLGRGGGPHDNSNPRERMGTYIVEKSVFTKNIGYLFGSAIGIKDNLSQPPLDNAGFQLYIRSSQFIDNLGVFDSPSFPLPSTIAIISSAGDFVLQDSLFNDHNLPLSQSLFYIGHGIGTFKIIDNVFENANPAGFSVGGQLFIGSTDNENLIAKNIFRNNYAPTGQVSPGSGGAIFLRNVNNLTIKNNLFYKNRADEEGGAIYLDESTIFLLGNKFIKNSASNGGALFLLDSSLIQNRGNIFIKNRPNNIAYQGIE